MNSQTDLVPAPASVPAPAGAPEDLAQHAQFVDWMRSVAPYIHAFRNKTFVVGFGGEVVHQGLLNALVSGHRAVAGHGHPDRAGARLATAGRRADEPARRGIGVLARHAHYRRPRARIRERSGRRSASGYRGRDQPGLAEHADGARAHQRRVGQFRDSAAGRHSGRRRFRAHRRGAQDRRGFDPPFAREPQAGAAVAARLLADRRSVQSVDGRRRLGRGHRAARRQDRVPDRNAGPDGSRRRRSRTGPRTVARRRLQAARKRRSHRRRGAST